MNSQLQAVLRQLSITQRLGIIGAALASVAAIAVLVMFASKPDFTPAFSKLSATDAGSLSAALRTANVPFEVADGGTTILVPVSALGDARIAAAQAGIVTDGAGKGMELFDSQGFGQSQFDEQVTYQRAIEGELTRTIQAMQGVASARVAIVLAQKGVLSDQDTPASASIVLSLSGGASASNGLVQAIVNTVAGSVSGLTADNVVVTDDKGHVLAGAADSASSAGAQAQNAVEQQLKAKVQALVDLALGAGKSSVAVTANVDMSKVDESVTTYTPVTDQAWTPVSVHTVTETYGGGSGSPACGIAGSTSNIPGVPSYPGACIPTAAASPSASGSPSASATASPSASSSPAASASAAGNYIHQEETVNYNLSQTVQHVIQSPGVVKKVSVAVLVDQKALGTVTPQALQTSIEAAIGADKARGDVVAVSAIPFAAQAAAKSTAASSDITKTVGDVAPTIVGIVFAIAMLALFWLNSRALRRRAEESALDLGPAPAAGYLTAAHGLGTDDRGALGGGAAMAPLPEPTAQAQIQDRLRMVADEKPDALVGLMHGWLREEDRRR